MSNISSESEDRMMSRDCINSPSVDDVSTERNMLGNGTLKKGPWTSAEDAILVDYVNKHGEGNWNAVQKHSGLSRCGKSCRLRWANHLRPDLKKGAFTPEEERKIIELHAKMGNKWARMAVELPGRTDNEIKNFWNTRTKRRQRAGLSIYPPDVCPQALNENTQTQNMLTFDTSHAEMLPNNTFQIPAVEFKNFNSSHEFFAPNILDLPGGNFLDLPGGSLIPEVYNSNFLFPIPKRDRRSDTCAVYDGDPCGYYPAVDQRLEISSLSGSHAYFNGNPSSSGPVLWAQKMELPSLQYSTTTQMGSCNAAHSSSPLPSLESVDTLIQQPVLIGQRKSEDSGLLEAVLLQSQNLKMSKSNGTLNASVLPRDGTSDSSSQPDDDWEAYGGDPMSPLGHSAASVFSEYTPHLSGSSLDEHQSVEAISVKLEPSEEPGAKQFDREDKKPDCINFPRPDFLLGSNWFSPSSNAADHEEDRYLVSDPIRALLGEDFGCAFDKHISGSSPFEGLDYESSDKWDDISEICRGSGNC